MFKWLQLGQPTHHGSVAFHDVDERVGEHVGEGHGLLLLLLLLAGGHLELGHSVVLIASGLCWWISYHTHTPHTGV